MIDMSRIVKCNDKAYVFVLSFWISLRIVLILQNADAKLDLCDKLISYFMFLFNYKARDSTNKNHNLLCSFDPPNRSRLFLLVGPL